MTSASSPIAPGGGTAACIRAPRAGYVDGLPVPPARLLAAAALAATLCLPAATAPGAGEGALRDRIGAGKARERALGSAAARLGRLERATSREVALLERRVAAAEGDLVTARAAADRAAAALDRARRRVARLRGRLAEVRGKLADLLRSRYTNDQPDLVTVVLESDGFASLLETIEFLQRVQRSDTELLALVRDARADAGRQRRELAGLTVRRRAAAAGVARRRDALAGIAAGLRERRALLAQARAARLAALRSTRAGRQRAERALGRLLAERERAARSVGPGGPWAIPWPIVQCESGGQNLPPNGAGASGYYQFLPSTWAGLGGSTPAAYQATKAEQDRLAARLWAGGAGARNWVCASLVGAV